MTGVELEFDGQHWVVREQIGSGGFGLVYALDGEGVEAVAKFVPKEPGADRELLFELPEAENVIPILATGEYEEYWVLVMPKAEKSLREHLDVADGALELEEALNIIGDICDALVGIDGSVVHRDLKPGNILLYEGKWCLGDFGIARYAEASTSTDTHKFALSAPYAAPERWRFETATTATDVYALGVIAYEAVSGERPFPGPTRDMYREQHLHQPPPTLDLFDPAFATIVDECLYKPPGARPPPANLRQRIDRINTPTDNQGQQLLAEANRAAVRRRSEEGTAASQAQSAAEQRAQLVEIAENQYLQMSDRLRRAVRSIATSAGYSERDPGSWSITLMDARLTLFGPVVQPEGRLKYGEEEPLLDVVLSSQLSLQIPRTPTGYEGRSHSLWYCDAEAEGSYAWYETAFMMSPMIPRKGRQGPFALDPGQESGVAIAPVVGEFQLAWPFLRLEGHDFEEFLDRWIGWLGMAAQGQLGHPSKMPEREPRGSHRKR